MNDLDRLRELLPIVVAFLLASSVAQFQARQTGPNPMPGISFRDVVAGLERHLIEIASNEQNESFVGLVGD